MKTLRVDGLKLIDNKILYDERGFFMERYKKELFSSYGLPDFVQDNHSRSKPNVVRGLHFQTGPAAQGKLVSVVRGRILDVALDLRRESSTYGQFEAIELSDKNGLQLWIPQGFAHGFCVLGDEEADVFYKVDRPYSPGNESGIRFDDPTVGIPWPGKDFIVSAKDLALPAFIS